MVNELKKIEYDCNQKWLTDEFSPWSCQFDKNLCGFVSISALKVHWVSSTDAQ